MLADNDRFICSGFVTAKVGRPDIYRAGAYILRLLHSSTVPWAFLPPSLSPAEQGARDREMDGLWLHQFQPRRGATGTGRLEEVGEADSDSAEGEEDGESDADELASDDDEGSNDDEEDDSANEKAIRAIQGTFAALAVEEGKDDDESEEESEPDRSG